MASSKTVDTTTMPGVSSTIGANETVMVNVMSGVIPSMQVGHLAPNTDICTFVRCVWDDISEPGEYLVQHQPLWQGE